MKAARGAIGVAFVLAPAVACNALLDIPQLHGSSKQEDAGDAGKPAVTPDAEGELLDAGELVLPDVRAHEGASPEAAANGDAGSSADEGASPEAAANGNADADAGCFPRPSGLVSWWRAEGNADDSVGPNNGTPTNVTFVPGVVGQAFHFPGDPVGGDVVAGAAGLPTGGDDRTAEMWVRLDATYEAEAPVFVEGEFFGYGGWGTPNGVYNLDVCAGGAPSLPTDSLGFSQWGGLLAPSVLNEDVWHHVAATWASGTVAIYVDGSLAVSDSTSFAIATSDGGTVCMGGIPTSALPNSTDHRWLTGAIDEVSVYTRALRPAEIRGIFLAGSLGKCLH
jgi:hypothetical protein